MTTTLEDAGLLAPTEGFPWPTAALNTDRLAAYLRACAARGIGYGLGDKADADGRDLCDDPPCYAAIDCSGWVRAAVAVATAGRTLLPDGSVCQNDWCAARGLKRSDPDALRLRDGRTRIAFIRPSAAHPVGHVYLARNGRTLESWGGNGPGSRSVSVRVLATETTDVYVLAV